MPRVLVPRDDFVDTAPTIHLSINGRDHSFLAGVETDLTDAEYAALLTTNQATQNRGGIPLAGYTLVAEEGGGEVTPLVSADFKNGVYSIGGAASSLAAMWEENVLWTPFSVGDVVADVGLTLTSATFVNAGPVMKATPFALLSGGFVAVLHVVTSLGATSAVSVGFTMTDLPDYTEAWEVYLYDNTVTNDQLLYVGDYTTAPQEVTYTQASPFKIAARCAAAGLHASVDGAATVSTGVAEANLAATTIGLSIGIPDAPESGTSTITLEKIEFFSLADYDASDLPTLSALS